MQPPTAPRARKPQRRRWRGLLVNLAIVLVIFLGVQWYKSRPLASGSAPPLAGETALGKHLDLAGLRGAPTLVHFWATWCPTCKLEEGGIDALSRDYQVVTVAMQSGGRQEVVDYLREKGLGFDAIPDPYGEIASAWGVPAVPASFVLDAAGKIRFGAVGYTPAIALRGRLWAMGGAAKRHENAAPAVGEQ
ncbi:MAG: protein disulfide oxidoreductase [Thiohalocapsa sp.]|jgi:thiol-disulfide isomerase/thioredoxin|uniref:protein disulfide oxidoreductase n=1 Tax=Thiohalocapsa sp. TaxID=2497641 RepID=UPI0025E33E5D|nr:protein disulfide oxidoreductase [Thiohalocapsa sp.]MCG6941018.1 protein disulfide oxidoreductase [Thiohalocapsa sp.]